ncbi:MAG TPA: hypothetical protein VG032_05275 [Acidimicrobiales bacterium]|nr:hypothetical protein [Acidimicrobiales bacterium]
MAYVGWVVFTCYLFAQAHGGPVVIWNDSKAYESVARAPLWSHSFWWGQRPPLTPLLVKMFGTAGGFLTAQAVIGALSWGVLAWTVGRLADPGWRRVAATWLVLGFAAAQPVTMWNRSLLSESLSMSLLALMMAGFIWTARRVTWPRVAATATAGLCFAATRDAQVWTVAMLGVAVTVLVLARTWKSPGASVRAGTLAVCLLVVAGVTEWGTLASHRSTGDAADVFFVRVFPYPARVAWFAAHGMPEARQIDGLAASTAAPPGVAKVVALGPGDRAFADLERWLHTHGASAYLGWMVAHPWSVVTEPLLRPERSYNFAHGNLTFYAARNDMSSPLTPLAWPPLAALGGLAAVAGYLAVRRRAFRDPAWRVVAVVTAVGFLAMLVAWTGDGQEVTRHTVEGFAELRLGIWILLVLGLLARPAPRARRAHDAVAHPAEDAEPVPLASTGRRHRT